MKVCGNCEFHLHDPTDKQDRGMIELGYKPCTQSTTSGQYMYRNFIGCEKFVHKHTKETKKPVSDFLLF